MNKVIKRIFKNPLVFSLLLCLILSASLFYIDKEMAVTKANRVIDEYVSIIEENFLTIVNQRRHLHNNLRSYLFVDTTLQNENNTDDKFSHLKDYIAGYIKVDCIYNTAKDSVIDYVYGDTLATKKRKAKTNKTNIPTAIESVPVENENSMMIIHPYKIITSDSNSNEIMSEILNIIRTNDYFADFKNKKYGVDFIDCYLPPNYLTTTNRYLLCVVTK
jgi:uncharacterized protein YutD